MNIVTIDGMDALTVLSNFAFAQTYISKDPGFVSVALCGVLLFSSSSFVGALLLLLPPPLLLLLLFLPRPYFWTGSVSDYGALIGM
jgi:hypothetical protein